MSLERSIMERLQARRILHEEMKAGQFYKDKQQSSNPDTRDDEHVDNPDGTRYTVGKTEDGKYGVWHMTKDGDYVDSYESPESFSTPDQAKQYAMKTRQTRYREALDLQQYLEEYEITIIDALRDAGLTASPLSAEPTNSGYGVILNIEGRKYKLEIDGHY